MSSNLRPPMPRRSAVLRWASRGVSSVLALLLLAVVVCSLAVVALLRRNVTPAYPDILEHFKYGSIGAEGRLGIPAPIFQVMPVVFEDLLPSGPGKGYERFGFLHEPGHPLPIGTSVRESPIPLVGLNCAVCHTATLRDAPGASRQLVFGASANLFNSWEYVQFLIKIGGDPRFTADILVPAIQKQEAAFSSLDAALYRLVVIPQMRKRLVDLRTQFAWLEGRPAFGPGRVDTFNPYKVLLGVDMSHDHAIGTADFPPLFNQRPREGMNLHWDGNNSSVVERNKSAAIGAGATPASLDVPALGRIEEWIQDLQAPRYPKAIDSARSARGQAVWERQCATCHAWQGSKVGQVTPLDEVGTDPERLRSFTPELTSKMNTLGTGYPWRFSHFRTTNGYANAPLDGVWLRSPYLHNGSVPTLRALLFPEERPKVFFRGYDVFDWQNVGYVSSGPDAERLGSLYDTRLPGNDNAGHRYGAELSVTEREDLLEYLKTL